MNALKHGLRATDEIFLQSLNPQERKTFRQLKNIIQKHYKPRTDHEQLLVDQIAIQHFRGFWLHRLEQQAAHNLSPDQDISNYLMPLLDRFTRHNTRILKDIKTLHNRLFKHYFERGDLSILPYVIKE